MKVAALIPAAGSGKRMGGGTEKQFLYLGSKPLLAYTLERFQQCEVIDEIYIILPQGKMTFCEDEIVKRYAFSKVKELIAGGERRQDSVYYGLKAVKPDTMIVVIHDGVRPFIEESLIRHVIEAAREWGAAIAALPEQDTIKEVTQDQFVSQTIDREKIWRVQTPQAFHYPLLWKAFEKAMSCGYYGTDEAYLIEQIGHPIKIVGGSPFNIKVTTPDDLVLGEAILQAQKR
ncbi:MAG: 2-C-methyl-D-erythritol 4-phosphate cytidylyltransferase [Candidatus Tectomicrobia bacterium]|nr:2-C-methyl-D-erythritol 4-phosphate cytidylyltransferase [Candidatus Tectomicrobia bacterium]